jgi:hypothetical protein
VADISLGLQPITTTTKPTVDTVVSAFAETQTENYKKARELSRNISALLIKVDLYKTKKTKNKIRNEISDKTKQANALGYKILPYGEIVALNAVADISLGLKPTTANTPSFLTRILGGTLTPSALTQASSMSTPASSVKTLPSFLGGGRSITPSVLTQASSMSTPASSVSTPINSIKIFGGRVIPVSPTSSVKTPPIFLGGRTSATTNSFLSKLKRR